MTRITRHCPVVRPRTRGPEAPRRVAPSVWAALAALLCAFVIPAAAAAAPTGRWAPQDSMTASDIHQLACPAASVCYAAAGEGTIIGTTDGGRHWNSLLSGASNGVDSIACPAARTARGV